MFKDKKITIISTVLATVFSLSLIGGPLFYLLLARQQRFAEEASMANATAWSNTISGLQRTATIQVRATSTALTEASTATTEAWSTTVASAQTASVAELARTVTIQAEATSIAFTRATATAHALAAAATARTRFTATAQAQAAAVANRRATATAEVQVTSTAQAQSTELNRALSATVAAAKATTAAEVKATVTTAVQATATAEVKATATARSEAGMLLIFEFQEVTIVKDQSDGLDKKMEFFMKLRVSDNQHSASMSYPAEGGAIPVVVNQLIPLNQHTIAIDERNIIGDEITIDIVAVDVDDQSIDEELLGTLVEVLIDYGSIGTASKFKKLSGLIPFVEEYVERVQKPLEDYFDLIGQDKIILRRSERWGAGPMVVYRKGGGLNIKYRVYLADKAPIPSTEWPR